MLQIGTDKISLESHDGKTWEASGSGSLDKWAELAQVVLVEQSRARAREEGGEAEIQRLRNEIDQIKKQIQG